jgi:hypothetical protein
MALYVVRYMSPTGPKLKYCRDPEPKWSPETSDLRWLVERVGKDIRGACRRIGRVIASLR